MVIILPVAFIIRCFYIRCFFNFYNYFDLFLGGIYLAYEGAEKIFEYFFHRNQSKENRKILEMTEIELIKFEEKKVKSAITVDFILSVEIIIIALSTVVGKQLGIQITVVSIVALLAVVGVYGIVALIVRMDDFGYKLIALSNNKNGILKILGSSLVKVLPYVIRGLALVGTIAMILVAGGIYIHNIHFLHNLLSFLPTIVAELLIGLVVGFIALILVKTYFKIKNNAMAINRTMNDL